MSAIDNIRADALMKRDPRSEAQLRIENPAIQDAWAAIQEVREEKAEAKRKASEKIDLQYSNELRRLEENYAMLLKLHL